MRTHSRDLLCLARSLSKKPINFLDSRPLATASSHLKWGARDLCSTRSSIEPENTMNLACDDNAFHQYTSGRWLWNEAEQLSRRYVKFNIAELSRIAARSVESAACVEIQKLPEGNFNKILLLTMNDGKEVIAKIPNPNAGRPGYTTASEVATMDFARQVLKIPAPKVFAWCSKLSNNPVNAEYIIMEKAPGVELGKLWEDLTGRQRYEVVKQIVGYEKAFASTRFTMFGSLYYATDLPNTTANDILCMKEDGTDMFCSRFAIGPSNSRVFFDDGKASLDMDRGPWRSTEEYVVATARREMASIVELPDFPRPQGLFYGPGQYKPTSAYKLAALTNYLKVAPHILPENADFRSSIMWHSDLHTDNIFVDPENPTEITSIIDWQSTHLSPLFLQARHPALIHFDGPIPPGFDRIELPENFDELSPEQQKDAKVLRSAQSLYKLYEIELRQQKADIFCALRYHETLPCKISAFAGSLFSDGEPIFNGLLIALERDWPKFIGVGPDGRPAIPCPLAFSSHDKTIQSQEEAKWIKGVELMETVLEDLGVYRGWDGWVNHNDYATMRARLEKCLDDFLGREAKSDEERVGWIKAWPFADSRLS